MSDQTGVSKSKPASKIANPKLELRHNGIGTENERDREGKRGEGKSSNRLAVSGPKRTQS